jgi:hypothetical protein
MTIYTSNDEAVDLDLANQALIESFLRLAGQSYRPPRETEEVVQNLRAVGNLQGSIAAIAAAYGLPGVEDLLKHVDGFHGLADSIEWGAAQACGCPHAVADHTAIGCSGFVVHNGELTACTCSHRTSAAPNQSGEDVLERLNELMPPSRRASAVAYVTLVAGQGAAR